MPQTTKDEGAKFPYRVDYKAPGKTVKKIRHTSESAARHEAERLARRGNHANFLAYNPRSGKYVIKDSYAPLIPQPS